MQTTKSFYEQDAHSSYDGDGLVYSLTGNWLSVHGKCVSHGGSGPRVKPYSWNGPVNRERVCQLFGERIAEKLYGDC